MALTPAQCRAAREILDWTQDDLAHAAGVSIFTLRDFEDGKPIPDGRLLALLRRAFEGAGLEFRQSERGMIDVRLVGKRD
jgi:DNA-binding transcriptional regulator YiaG